MKKEKGITLTSLVITIIILLIIASISVFSGTHTIKYAKWNKAKSEMETVQTQVNAWHEEYKNLSETKIKTYINDIGEEITADKAENAGEEISNLDDYRFLSAEYIKDKFGIDGNNEFIVNIKTRDVILYKGIEYEGEKYYTSEDFNINNTQSIEISGISFDVKQGNGNEVIISNLKLNYPSDDNTSLSKFRVQYKKENTSYFIDVTSNLTKYTEQEEKDGMKQEVTKFKFQVVGAGSYTIKVSTMDGKQSDTKIIYVFPVLEVASISPTDWTNQDVTVTLPTAKDFITVYTTDGTAPIASNSTEYSKPFTVSENCTVIYAYKGGDEVDSTTKTIEIANIDKIAPTNTTPTATATTNSITITSKQTDDGGSGIKSVQYSKDGGSTWQSSNKFTGLKQTTSYTIATRTTDNAGNATTSQTLSVTTGTIGAVGTASINPTGWTNGNVTVTLPTSSGFTTKYTTNGSTPTASSTSYSAPFTVSSNCTIMYVYTDGTNINTAGTLKVTNIDKTAPTAPQITAKMNDSSGATYNSGTWTNNNIYVELTSTETQSGIKEYQWYENGEWTTRELFTASNKGAITYTVNRDVTLRFRVVDNVGNISSENTIVAKIDKTAPTNTAPTATHTTNSITVTSKQTDDGGSAIKKVEYSKDGGSTWQSSNKFTGLKQSTAYSIATRTTDNAGNATTSQTLSVTTGTIGAVGTASASPTTWTNGNVTVTLPTSSGFTTKYTTNGSTPTASSTTYSAPFTVSSNCTIMYVYTDGTNINTAGTLKITNIDKIAPTNTAPTATKTTNSITVTSKQTDSGGSGIKTTEYSIDGGKTWQSSNKFTGLKQTTSYTIATRTTDNAGNATTSQTLSVTTGTIGAVGTASQDPTALTSGNVTVTLPTTSGLTTRYTTDGSVPTTSSTAYSTPFTVSENCTVMFIYTDGTNVNTAGTLKITNIDKTNYTITYNLNGGSVSGNPTTYKVDTSTITLKDPTKSGYTFLGWTGSKDLSGGLNSYTSSSPYVAASRDHILGNEFNVTAGEKYRVFVKGNRTKGSLNLQGGIWYTAQTSGASYDGYNGDFAETGTGTGVFYKDITIPTGKTKGKFYIQLEQSSGSFTTSWNLYDMHVIKVGNTTIPTGSSGNKSYTANWSANSYTISFNGNGGSNGTSITKAYGNTIGPLPTSTRTGYTFNGWYTATSGGTKIETTTKMPSSNTTYYAQWTAKNYTVTYNANGGTGAPANQTATYDSKFTVSTTQPTRTGYTFSGWKDPTGVSSWTNWSGTWKYDNGQYGITNNTLTLTAQWTPKTYTVTYNANGGTGAPANQTATYDSKFTVSTTVPTRAGYTFSGWKDPTGDSSWTNWSGTWKYDNGQYGITNNTLTLTAQWTANTYTIAFNGNGNTGGSTASESMTYGTAKALTANGFTKTGYTFAGWATSASGSKVYDDKQSVNNLTTTNGGTVTLYATWKVTTLMNCSSEELSSASFLGNSTIARNKIERVNLVTSISGHSTNDANCWDVSDGKNGQILAWYEDKDSDGYYEVTIGQNGGIIANPDSSHLFNYIGHNGDDTTVINGIGNLNTEFATNMSYMFYGCNNLVSLDLSNFNTSKVTDMSHMFASDLWFGTNKLTSLNLSSFNTKNVTRMNEMFGKCAFTSLDVSNFDTSNVTDMEDMFYNCSNLTSLNVSNFNTSNVTNMQRMFLICSKLTSLDLSKFDTSKVTDMEDMFQLCYNLTSLNVSNFNTGKVTNMAYMFESCSKLTSLNVSNFNTSKVTNMSGMFVSCSKLTSLNVSNFNTSKVTDMSSMFCNCLNLTSLNVSNFDTSNVTDMSSMFSGVLIDEMKLTNIDVSNFDTSNVTDMEDMFHNCSNLTSLNVSNFNTSKVTNMSGMFVSCSKLTSLNVSNFNTSNVTDMRLMFYGCSNLTSLDVSNFDTSNVTDMGNMFDSCSKLTSLNVSNFNTSNVTYMAYMFDSCSKLTSLNVSNINTRNVTDMRFMFCGCSNLTSLNVSSFNTSKVTSMVNMFSGCLNLTSLDVSNFDTSKVTNMSGMFGALGDEMKLTNIDVSNFNTSNVTDMSDMFKYCKNLTSLDTSKFDTSKVIDMSDMFCGCSNLTSLNVSSFNTSKVTDMSGMFSLCFNLKTIYVGRNWNIGNVTNSTYMFLGDRSLVGGAGTSYDNSNSHTDKAYAHIDGGTSNPGYFTSK